MRVVGSWKAERIASNREPADRRRNGSEPVQYRNSRANPQKDNRRVKLRIHSIFAGLHARLDDTLVKGVGRIEVKRIKGEVYKEKNQKGETHSPATPSSALISHDRPPHGFRRLQPLAAPAPQRYQLSPCAVNHLVLRHHLMDYSYSIPLFRCHGYDLRTLTESDGQYPLAELRLFRAQCG